MTTLEFGGFWFGTGSISWNLVLRKLLKGIWWISNLTCVHMHTINFNFLTFGRNLKLNRTNWEQSSDVNQRSVRRTLLSSDFIIESESLQLNGRWCRVDLPFVLQYPSLRGCAGNVMVTCDDDRKNTIRDEESTASYTTSTAFTAYKTRTDDNMMVTITVHKLPELDGTKANILSG